MKPVPLLLLPGLLCDARLWRDQAAALVDVADVTIADLSQDDSLDAMADRALALMPDRFAVAGFSMGGYAAFALLRRAPSRVIRLCLLDTSARSDTPDQARRRRGLLAMVRKFAFRGVTTRLLSDLLHWDRLEDVELAAEVMEMAERVGKEGFLRQEAAILTRPDSRAELARIRVPTLVGVGDADTLTPPELAAEIAAGIAGARLRVVPRSGHMTPMEQPAEVGAIMRAWISDAADPT